MDAEKNKAILKASLARFHALGSHPTDTETGEAIVAFLESVAELPGMPAEFWPKAVFFVGKVIEGAGSDRVAAALAGMEARAKEGSRAATDARHAENRELAERAKSVAADLWRGGSERRHHKMKAYLAKEYKDSTGVNPFKTLPDKPFLTACREAAEMIGRPDLIFGKQPTVRKK